MIFLWFFFKICAFVGFGLILWFFLRCAAFLGLARICNLDEPPGPDNDFS